MPSDIVNIFSFLLKYRSFVRAAQCLTSFIFLLLTGFKYFKGQWHFFENALNPALSLASVPASPWAHHSTPLRAKLSQSEWGTRYKVDHLVSFLISITGAIEPSLAELDISRNHEPSMTDHGACYFFTLINLTGPTHTLSEQVYC